MHLTCTNMPTTKLDEALQKVSLPASVCRIMQHFHQALLVAGPLLTTPVQEPIILSLRPQSCCTNYCIFCSMQPVVNHEGPLRNM